MSFDLGLFESSLCRIGTPSCDHCRLWVLVSPTSAYTKPKLKVSVEQWIKSVVRCSNHHRNNAGRVSPPLTPSHSNPSNGFKCVDHSPSPLRESPRLLGTSFREPEGWRVRLVTSFLKTHGLLTVRNTTGEVPTRICTRNFLNVNQLLLL